MRREDLEAMTVAELKILLSNLALPVSGKKADLIDRILQNQDPKIVEEDPSSSEIDGGKIERQLMKRLNPSSRT